MNLEELLTEAERRELYICLETKWRAAEPYRFTCRVAKRGSHGEGVGGHSNKDFASALDDAIAQWDARNGGDE